LFNAQKQVFQNYFGTLLPGIEAATGAEAAGEAAAGADATGAEAAGPDATTGAVAAAPSKPAEGFA
jgi:hypothetical protein